MPDTFFTASPHWGWLIVFYLFVGAIAGGCFFLAALLHLFGKPVDQPAVRTGYFIALAGALVGAILLVIDLTQPLRFWHMLIQSNTGAPMFKGWSPMSVGSWGFAAFGFFATLAAAGAWAQARRPGSRLTRLATGLPGKAIAVIGIALGLFVAGYSGVMLSVTNRPLWGDSAWIGGLFLSSAVSISAATLALASLARRRAFAETLEWLHGFARGGLVLQFIFLVVFVASLGAAAQILAGAWGAALVAVLVGGIIVPLIIHVRRPPHDRARMVLAAALVVAGGFLLRAVVMFSSENVYVTGAGVHGL